MARLKDSTLITLITRVKPSKKSDDQASRMAHDHERFMKLHLPCWYGRDKNSGKVSLIKDF
jgi:hypothetical protein